MGGLDITSVAKKIVRQHFRTKQISELVPLPGRRHVFLVAVCDRRYILKCVAAPSIEASDLKFTHKLVGLLNDRHFSTYSLVPGPDGRTWVVENGLIWEVHTFVDGVPLRSLAHSPNLVGELLGSYHRTVKLLIQDGLLQVPNRSYQPFGSVDPVIALKAVRSLVGIRANVGLIDEIMDKSVSWRESLEPPTVLVPTHGDIAASNIIIAPEGAYLIDFERTPWEDPLVDLAQAIARIVTIQGVSIKSRKEAIENLIASYVASSRLPRPARDRLFALVSLHIVLDWACELLCSRSTVESLLKTHSALQGMLADMQRCLV